MTSTTQAKKETLDFLWEWAEQKGDWAKLLIDKIVNTETTLTDQDRNDVFDRFIDAQRTTKTFPPLNLSKPNFTFKQNTVQLASLSGVIGVNKLAKDQQIDFSPNITVIYGENGSGKTGYGRILKSLGFSYDPHNPIHANIYGTIESKAAKIDYTLNGSAKSFQWTGASTDDLSSISVFNNNCVQLSLADRKLIVSPMGFHLFNLVTTELNELANMLNQKKASYPTTISFSAALHEGTPQQTFIQTLSEKSTEGQLKAHADFAGSIITAIEEKQKQLNGINKELLTTQIQNLTNQINELETLAKRLGDVSQVFNKQQWKSLPDLNKSILELQRKTKVGLKELADKNQISFFDSTEFKGFLEAAEKYIKLLEQPYPEQADTCVFCKQPLDESAHQLITSYRSLLNDTTEQDLTQLLGIRSRAIQAVSGLEESFALIHASFGVDADQKPVQPNSLLTFNAAYQDLKKEFIENNQTEGKQFGLDYSVAINALQQCKEGLQEAKKTKSEALTSMSETIAQLQRELNELKDRKLLGDNFEEVKKVILNKKQIAVLNSKAGEFSTNAISRKTSEARDELVTQNFEADFLNELIAFRKSHLKIDLSFGTDKGNSKIVQKINRYNLADILSEGEQKAIALAEFLTELNMDKTNAPVVFDDPVNSLDHTIIEEVALRLIKLSISRQVIIFTHSILLLNSIIQQSNLDTNKQAGVNFKFYSLKNNFGETGFLFDVEEVNSHSYYIKKLNEVLQTKDKSLSEEKLAAEGYGHLRSAIEICVEEDILKTTIKRYRKGVAFPSLLRIQGDRIDAHKADLNQLYEKCCTSIDGHSSPEELHVTPTITGLNADFQLYTSLRKKFTS